jgi:PAS domain S-box-containing protein
MKKTGKQLISHMANLENRGTLYLFVFLYALYWIFFPSFVEYLGSAYSLLVLFFIFTASLFWGLTGGLIVLGSVFLLRGLTTVVLKLPYYGGPFAPIIGLMAVMMVGGLSDYVKTLECEIKDEYERSPAVPAPTPHRNTVVKDTVVFSLICLITLAISSRYDLMEKFYDFSREYKAYEIDEYMILLLIIVFYACVFSFRRWQDLRRELVNRRRVEQVLQRSETRYRSIVNNANEGIGVFRQGKTLFINPYALKVMGYRERDMFEKSFLEFIHPEDRDMVVRYHFDRLSGKEVPDDYLIRLITRQGTVLSVRVTGVAIDWEGQAATLNFLKDVTEVVRAEDDLKKALHEKDILLKEIHHRVKNNMQIVSSLLNLQINRESDANVIGPLRESQSRVFAMALVHEQLYRNESFASINLSQYLEKLIVQLSSSFHAVSKPEIIACFDPDLTVSLNQAIPCGLLMNEMVTNALKHGYPDNRTGKIRVEGRRSANGMIEISVQDDGVGLPASFDLERTDTLGLSLILGLVRGQLGGSVTMKQDHGTTFTISFLAGES